MFVPSMLFVVVIILVIIAIIVFLVYHFRKTSVPLPWTPSPTPKPNFPGNISKNPVTIDQVQKMINTLVFVDANLFCGVVDQPQPNYNQGPNWKNTPSVKCGQNYGQQDFWLSGVCIDTLARYSLYAKDPTYVDSVLSKMPQSLNDQLMKGWNGAWNDDTIWFLLAFVSMYEYGVSVGQPMMFSQELQWANDNYERMCNATYNNVDCANWNKTFTVTWWETFQDTDPNGINTYRNSITNGLLLLLGMRLYNLYGNFNATYTKDTYYTISKTLADFLQSMRTDTGLITDGLSKPKRNSVNEPATCSWSDGYYTYIQGVVIGAFGAFSVAAYEKKDTQAYNNAINFTRDLVDLMTLTPDRNTTNSPGSCNINVINRTACGNTTDQNTCSQNTGCCYEATELSNAPCYNKASPAKNPFLVTVNGVSILTEYNSTEGGNSMIFKGIFSKYLGYTVQTLINFYTKYPDLATDRDQQLVTRSIEFLRQNFDWASYNAQKDSMYSGIWQFTQDQTSKLDNKWFTTGSTMAMVDLFTTCVALQGVKQI